MPWHIMFLLFGSNKHMVAKLSSTKKIHSNSLFMVNSNCFSYKNYGGWHKNSNLNLKMNISVCLAWSKMFVVFGVNFCILGPWRLHEQHQVPVCKNYWCWRFKLDCPFHQPPDYKTLQHLSLNILNLQIWLSFPSAAKL